MNGKYKRQGLIDEIHRFEAALTPSIETKAAYMGEFKFKVPLFDDDGNEYTQEFLVPWTTIKEIMAAILAYKGK